MPSRWEIALTGPAGVSIPLIAPLAVVSGWLDGDRIVHKSQRRPWALTPPWTRTDGSTVLGVRLLDDSLGSRLVAATSPGSAVRLGHHHFTVTAPARHICTTAWPELAEPRGERAWQLRVATPAAIRRGRRTSPWLSPDAVAHGLLDRWRLLDPQSAPALPQRGFSSIWVSDFQGRSEVIELRGQMVSGFVGRLRYRADDGPDAGAAAAAFGALMAFAAFAGIGSHTTTGFGVVEPEPPPP